MGGPCWSYLSKMLNSSLKSGLVSMTLPHDLRVYYQFQRRLENSLRALALPEGDVEPILRIADLAIRFSKLRHWVFLVVGRPGGSAAAAGTILLRVICNYHDYIRPCLLSKEIQAASRGEPMAVHFIQEFPADWKS